MFVSGCLSRGSAAPWHCGHQVSPCWPPCLSGEAEGSSILGPPTLPLMRQEALLSLPRGHRKT